MALLLCVCLRRAGGLVATLDTDAKLRPLANILGVQVTDWLNQ
jgi:hypothetical protein